MIGLAWMFACLPPTPPPTKLDSVLEVPETDADRMVFTAIAYPAFAGEITRQARTDRGPSFRYTLTVVPLLPPGQTLPDAVVHAWVTHQERHTGSREPWFRYVRENFDGKKEQTLHPLPNREGTGWGKAILDAEARHGIRSHPDARVFQLPAPPRGTRYWAR